MLAVVIIEIKDRIHIGIVAISMFFIPQRGYW